MSTYEQSNINHTDSDAGPSIEESFEALKAEGLVSDESDGAIVESNAQGGAGEAGEGVNEDRPSWLPEGFDTPEEFAEAYAKLKEGSDEETPEEDADETDEVSEEEAAGVTDVVTKAGLDIATLSEKWFDKGSLDDTDYDVLAKQGFPRDMVDTYCEGLAQRTGSVVYTAYTTAGGEEAYNDMITWAAEYYSDEEVAAFDENLNSKSKTKVAQAVKALRADYTAAMAEYQSEEPEEPLSGGGAPRGDVYESQDEYMLDLMKPEYDQNETFRQKVMAKLGRSQI